MGSYCIYVSHSAKAGWTCILNMESSMYQLLNSTSKHTTPYTDNIFQEIVCSMHMPEFSHYIDIGLHFDFPYANCEDMFSAYSAPLHWHEGLYELLRCIFSRYVKDKSITEKEFFHKLYSACQVAGLKGVFCRLATKYNFQEKYDLEL